ncbi:MAG: hypothetical protein Q9187_005646 [Circinaria calcarea]
MDGKKRVSNQIKWIIQKGDKIDSDSPFRAHEFYRTFLANTSRAWYCEFYTSFNDRAQLPTNIAHGKLSRDASLKESFDSLIDYLADATQLCTVKADLSKVDIQQFEHVKYHLLNKFPGRGKQSHYTADYKIKLVIGAADLRFELWFQGMQYMEDNSLAINFD